MKSSSFKIFAYLAIGVVFLLFVGVIVLAGSCLLFAPVKESKPATYDFRYYKFNPNTNEANFGFMTLASDIQDDFLSYQDSTGSHILVSPLGSNAVDFRCSGSCFCGKEEDRRSGLSGTLSRSLFYLVSAATSVVAVSVARRHFDDLCVERFSDSCDVDSIQSDVDVCVLATDSPDAEESEKKLLEVDGMGKVNREGTFFCRGSCGPMSEQFLEKYSLRLFQSNQIDEKMRNIVLKNKDFVHQKGVDFHCDRLKLEKVVKLDGFRRPFNRKRYLSSLSLARTQFVVMDLMQVCIYGSSQRMMLGAEEEPKSPLALELMLPVCGPTDQNNVPFDVTCVFHAQDV